MCETLEIYVACLASYNNGILHGSWIDATQDVELIRSEIKTILEKSSIVNAEEYAIHDIDCDYELGFLGEYSDIEYIHNIALFIEEHGDAGGKLLAHCMGLEEAKRILEEGYCGEFSNGIEYAEELYNEIYNIPDFLIYYIDYERIWNDLSIDGYFDLPSKNGGIHIFRSY